MTIAEYCVFAAVALYLLTIVPIKWMALREYDNQGRALRSTGMPFGPARLPAHQNGIEVFPTCAAAVPRHKT